YGSRYGNCPCALNKGKNEPYWYQRLFISRHSSRSVALGLWNLFSTRKPPASIVQYGVPDIEKFIPPAIWSFMSCHLEAMSPLQAAAAYRCCPAKNERVRIKTLLLGSVARCPS